MIAQIRAQIDSGEWSIGDRIPTETELSEQLEVGRNTVREAVRALAHAGLLEIRQGAGTFVRATSELGGALRRRLEHSRLRETLEVRRALELESARLAAGRRSEEDLAELDTILGRRTNAIAARDATEFVAADVALHRAVVEASHNSLLVELYGHIAQSISEGIAAIVQESGIEDAVDHTPLVEAIRGGDAEAAARETACFIDELLELTQEPGEG